MFLLDGIPASLVASATPVSAVSATQILVVATGLVAVALLLTGALAALTALRHWRRRWEARDAAKRGRRPQEAGAGGSVRALNRWLAIRDRTQEEVQHVLGLSNARPVVCRGEPPTAGGHQLAILPPVQGWTLVVGPELPDPSRDVDRCFRLLHQLSHALGEVQYFSVDWGSNHHAWARLQHGRVIRAFAWAGQTIWRQGTRTPAEEDLDMVCPDYGESSNEELIAELSLVNLNPDKLLSLAARWSLDPTRLTATDLARASAVVGNCRLTA
jgi:hypothetical protein